MSSNPKGIQRFLPNAIIVAVFIIICALFCKPILNGDQIVPHDTVSWLYMSKDIKDNYEASGETPGWSNSMFGGMPTDVTAYYIKSNWYNNLSQMLVMDTARGLPNPIMYLFIAMISFFMLMRSINVNRYLAGIGAIAFAFSSYNPIIIAAGHMSKMMDIALIPGILAGIIYLYKEKYYKGFIILGVFFAIYMTSFHIQIIYYSILLFVVVVVYFLLKAIKTQTVKSWFKSSIIALVAMTVASLTNFTGLLGTSQYAKHSIRGGVNELTIDNKKQASTGLDKDYAFQWSNGIGESFSVLVPNIYGGSSSEDLGDGSKYYEVLSKYTQPNQALQMAENAPTYWGDQPFLSGPIYFGAIICFLFVFGLYTVKSPLKWWISGVILIMFMISWGKNFSSFNYFLFDYFPLFNKFRTPSMALSIPSVLMPFIGIWGLYNAFFKETSKEVVIKAVKNSLYIVGGLTVLIILGGQFMFDFRGANDAQLQQSFGQVAPEVIKALREDRASILFKDAFRSLFFIVLTAGIIWAFIREKISQSLAIGVIGLAIIIDMLPVANRYLNSTKYIDDFTIEQQYFSPRPVDIEIKKDTDPNYRVLDLSINTFNDAKSSYFHKTIGGYHPAKLEIYNELIEMQISKRNKAVLNMLNTKYIIFTSKDNKIQAQPNPEALGNAWFVNQIKWVNTADEEMLALNAPEIFSPEAANDSTGFNPKTTAIIRNKFKATVTNPSIGKDDQAYIKQLEFKPNYIKYESNNSQVGLGVFSEIYYPENWHAFVDGKELDILKVDYVLRGLNIPAGKHIIEFKLINERSNNAEKVNLTASIILTLLILIAAILGIKSYLKEDQKVA